LKLTAALVGASLLAGTFPASAEIIAMTCVETIAGGTEGDPITESIRINTAKPEVTVLKRGDPTIEHYSNTTEKEKVNAANAESAQILRALGVDIEKSVSIAGNKVVWTSSQSFILFRAEYDRETNQLVEITSEQYHESVIRFVRKLPPPHEYTCR
jgi:hypothetical protein